MAYVDVAQLAQDAWFNQRIAAAAQIEGLVTDNTQTAAMDWAFNHSWDIAAAPGFGDAYASAIASEVPDPGKDPSVISDAMLLAAIQALPPA